MKASISTSCDFKVCKILANDLIETYLKEELGKLKEPVTEDGKKGHFPKERLSWTGKKVDLVALAYGLKHSDCFNYGNTSLIQIASYLGNVFNIDLGKNISREFHDLRSRKKNDSFFDRMRDNLDEYINGLDEPEK